MPLLQLTDFSEVKWSRKHFELHICPLCSSRKIKTAIKSEYLGREHEDEVRGFFCSSCGYWELLAHEWGQQDYKEDERCFESRLENFDSIASAIPLIAPAIEKISQRTQFDTFTPRQFEQLTYFYIRDIFNCEISLTKQTRDGGYDILCIDSNVGRFIVEAKRYKRTKVDVSLVRQLAGVQLINNIPNSVIVTTGKITKDAIREQNILNTFTNYHLDIHDTQDLMSWLDKKRVSEVKIPISKALDNAGFLRSTPSDFLVFDPESGELSFCGS